jgi:hypothetical protein
MRIMLVRKDGVLDQGGKSAVVINFGVIDISLKLEPTGFLNGLDKGV